MLPSFVKDKHRFERKFLILINPKSGKGVSEQIFQEQCLPIFRDAGIECTVVKTERQGHAGDICRDTLDLTSKYDGVVIVSGDGLLFEVIQGIMARPDWAVVIRNLPLGVLPGGSGNGLAVSLAHGSHEVKGAKSNAFLIAKGHVSQMDLCAVDHFATGRMYSFLSLELGMIADVDLESDWMRSLGDLRFTLQFLRRILKPRKLRVKLSYVPVEGDPASPKHGAPRVPSYWEEPDCYTGEGGPRGKYSVPLLKPVPQDMYKTIEDDFYLMWNTNVAWMSFSGHVSPTSRWDDGYMQMTFVRRGDPKKRMWPRRALVNYMLSIDSGAHVDDNTGEALLRHLEMVPTRAFRVEPIVNGNAPRTKMAVDGEMVEMGPIQFEVLPKIALLMGAVE